MLKNKLRALPAILVVLSMVVALVPTTFAFAADAEFTLTSVMQAEEPITNYVTDRAQSSSRPAARDGRDLNQRDREPVPGADGRRPDHPRQYQS